MRNKNCRKDLGEFTARIALLSCDLSKISEYFAEKGKDNEDYKEKYRLLREVVTILTTEMLEIYKSDEFKSI